METIKKPIKEIKVNDSVIPANIISIIPNDSVIYAESKIDLSKLDVNINDEEIKEFLRYLLNENEINLVGIK